VADEPAEAAQGGAGNAEHAPVEALRGVGPRIASHFRRLGIETVFDLLVHLPHRYEDRTRTVPLSALVPGRAFRVEGEIEAVETVRGRRPRLVCTLRDGGGETLRLVWLRFHAGQKAALRTGLQVRAFGPVTRYRGVMQMVHPEYRVGPFAGEEVVEPRLTPVYPTVQDG